MLWHVERVREAGRLKSDAKTSTYHIAEIPDPADSRYRATGYGRESIIDGGTHLLRALSHMPPESVSAELRFSFTPDCGQVGRQSRLGLFLRLRACSEAVLEGLDRLVQAGLLSRFYDFEKIDTLDLCGGQHPVTAHIVRREDFVRPLYGRDWNVRIPDHYYTIIPFVPNEKNDQLTLDSILDHQVQPVTITVQVSPANISDLMHAHTGYLALLGAVNRSWEDDNESDLGNIDLLEHESYSYRSVQSEFKPLRNSDPLADDIGRQQRRFHESLRQPHLCFSIRVEAKTVSEARLIGSVFAESAFEEGSYRIVMTEDRRDPQGPTEDSPHEFVSSLFPFTSYPGTDAHEYQDLVRLSHVATVDELAGAFRLPIASFASPCCIRKSTDPPYEREERLVVLGYDQEVDNNRSGTGDAVARGILIDQLRKHLFVSGSPGQGKTTCIMAILIQLRSLALKGKNVA